MGADTVEFKFEDGTAIKIKGSADFVAAVTTAILRVAKEKSSKQVLKDDAEPKPNTSVNRIRGLPAMFSAEWQKARTNGQLVKIVVAPIS